jgi:hypothetical protein
VLSNHVHLVVEADSGRALAQGMRALSGRLAKGLNRLAGSRGEVFVDRYHAHLLRTPREVRNAVAYVLGNFASHSRRKGVPVSDGVDPFSSAASRGPDGLPPPCVAPRTWLLREADAVVREPAELYASATA